MSVYTQYECGIIAGYFASWIFIRWSCCDNKASHFYFNTTVKNAVQRIHTIRSPMSIPATNCG